MAAYFVFHNKVHDADKMGAYIQAAIKTMEPYGYELVILDENSTLVEGKCQYPRTVVIRFPTREKAEAWYNSPEYRQVIKMRLDCTEGFGVLVNGFSM